MNMACVPLFLWFPATFLLFVFCFWFPLLIDVCCVPALFTFEFRIILLLLLSVKAAVLLLVFPGCLVRLMLINLAALLEKMKKKTISNAY